MTPDQLTALVTFLISSAAIIAVTAFAYALFSRYEPTVKHGVNGLLNRAPRPPDPPPQKPASKPWTLRDGFAVSADLGSKKVTFTVTTPEGFHITSTIEPGGALWMSALLNKAAHSIIDCPNQHDHLHPGVGFCPACDPEKKL